MAVGATQNPAGAMPCAIRFVLEPETFPVFMEWLRKFGIDLTPEQAREDLLFSHELITALVRHSPAGPGPWLGRPPGDRANNDARDRDGGP